MGKVKLFKNIFGKGICVNGKARVPDEVFECDEKAPGIPALVANRYIEEVKKGDNNG